MPAYFLRRFLWVCLGLVAASSVSVPPAAAHDQLVSTQPAAGERLTQSPAALTLTFSADVLDLGTTVVLRGADGTDVATGATTVTGPDVVVALPPLAPGDYTVVWRVVSVDGHPISGTFDFGVDGVAGSATPEPSSPAPSASATALIDTATTSSTSTGQSSPASPGNSGDGSAGPSTVVWAAVGAIVAVIAAVLMLARRARGRDT